VNRRFYFDVHGHPEGTLPAPLRLIPGNSIPADVRLAELADTGAAGFVLCVIGDPNSFNPLHLKIDPFRSVRRQLESARKRIAEAGALVALDAVAISEAAAVLKPALVLGIEGGDFLGEDLGRLDSVYALGVRLLVLVHFSKNAIGSISLGWGGRIISESERSGLSDFGSSVVRRANELGIVIDLAHADDETIRGALDASSAPMICSHTGPRSLQNFARYIPDELMKAISGAGGLIGLWPYRDKGAGIPDIGTFAAYAAHCADLVGTRHVAIGSDINGVPGNMAGYRNLFDNANIVEALSKRGFSEAELDDMAGRNFLRFFQEVGSAVG